MVSNKVVMEHDTTQPLQQAKDHNAWKHINNKHKTHRRRYRSFSALWQVTAVESFLAEVCSYGLLISSYGLLIEIYASGAMALCKGGLHSREFGIFVSGALAGVTSKTLTAPIETVRTRLIVGVGPHSITGSIRDIIHKSGWRGLWRGNGINALRSAPIQAIELSVYESVKKGLYSAHKRWAVDGPPQVNMFGQVVVYPLLYTSPSMIAGAVAGVVSTVSCYPLEVLKDRFTVHTGAYKSIWHAFGKIVHEEGMGAMYRGLLPTLIGLVPYSAAYYFVYDSLTREYRQFTKKKQLDSVETLFIGAFAGLASSAVTFPLEVARKRLMVGAVAGRRTPRNFGQTIKIILEEEGVRGFYRGIAASCLKVMPASGLSWMCYEKCKEVLNVDTQQT